MGKSHHLFVALLCLPENLIEIRRGKSFHVVHAQSWQPQQLQTKRRGGGVGGLAVVKNLPVIFILNQ